MSIYPLAGVSKMRSLHALCLSVLLLYCGSTPAQDTASCIATCTANRTAEESSGKVGGVLETGAKCGTEEGTAARPKRFSRGHRPPNWEQGAKWVSSGISDEYEGQASARLQNDGLELVVDSSCYTTGKGFKTEEAKYRWYGTWERVLTPGDRTAISDACTRQCH